MSADHPIPATLPASGHARIDPNHPCLFCHLPADRIVAETPNLVAIRDGFPVSTGHTLLIPRRHVASFRDLAPAEWADVLALARDLSAELQASDPSITGFNLGINDGAVAGQSIFHCHIHLIPRRTGDHPHPRGGVRGVIPAKQGY